MPLPLRLLMFLVLWVPCFVWAESPTHCKRGELTYFSCQIGSLGKVASICSGSLRSTNDGGDQTTWLQYRFGRLDSTEFAFPTPIKGSLSKFRGEHHQGQTVNSSTVIFRTATTEYTVGTIHPVGTGAAFDGVIVSRPQNELLWLPCTGRPIIFSAFSKLVESLEPVP